MAELDNSLELKIKSSSSSMNKLSSVLAAAVMQRINLPKLISASGSASSITIDQIRLNDTSVERVDVLDVKTEVDTGTVTLENARAIVSLSLRFNFGVHIPLPWPFDDINFGDSISLGGITFPFDIGDISIPELNNVDLEIPSAALIDIKATLEPVNNLNLGGAAFNGLELDDTVLPSAGFGLSGLSLGALSLTELTTPSVTSAHLSVAGFSPDNALLLPSISIENIQLPSTSAAQVTTVAPVVVPGITSETRNIPLTSGLLTTSIDISPTLTIAISSMVINNISAVSTISKIDIRDIRSTVEVSGVTANGLELNNVELESITTTA